MKVDAIIDGILRREGGYVDNPADRGGPTNHGITQTEARANGYQGDMRDLPVSLARTILLNKYIRKPGFDRVALHSDAIADKLADIGVNMGPEVASRFLQQSLNVLNNGGKLYPDIAVDGNVGGGTLAALGAYLQARGSEGETVMLKALNCLQGADYITIAEHRPADETFVYGWLRARISLPS